MKITIPLLAIAGFISVSLTAPTDVSPNIDTQEEGLIESNCISYGRSCPLDRPELCCSGKCIPTWGQGPICGTASGSYYPSIPIGSREVELPTATPSVKLTNDIESLKPENLEKRCISDGQGCDLKAQDSCCSGKCVDTWFAGPVCSYARVLCIQTGEPCSDELPCCSDKCSGLADLGRFCDVPEAPAKLESMMLSREADSQPDEKDDKVEPSEKTVSAREEPGTSDVVATPHLMDLEKRCISDGRSCPIDRPELCCSGKCVNTWFSGPICTYSTQQDHCKATYESCTQNEDCCSHSCLTQRFFWMNFENATGPFCDGPK